MRNIIGKGYIILNRKSRLPCILILDFVPKVCFQFTPAALLRIESHAGCGDVHSGIYFVRFVPCTTGHVFEVARPNSAANLCGMPFRGAQERKVEGAKSEAGKSDAETPVEAQDLTVFVQSVMEQMVRETMEA